MFKAIRQLDRTTRIILAVFLLGSVFLLKPRIAGDGFSYYAYLRSLVFDQDLDFTNEYTLYNSGGYWTAGDEITPAGLPANPFSVGPALFFAPWFFLAYLLTALTSPFLHLANDGYSFFYQTLIPFGCMSYVLLALLLLRKSLARQFTATNLMLTLLGILLASPLVNYTFYEAVSSHSLSFFIITLLYIHWLETKKYREKGSLLVGSYLGGLMCLTRWQHVIFLLPVCYDLLFRQKRIKGLLAYLLLNGLMLVPQLLAWKVVYGSLLVIPQGTSFFIPITAVQTWMPRILLLLFSPNHGFFFWTPLMLIACIGLFIHHDSDRFLARSILLVSLLSMSINSLVWEYYGGWAYGSRRMIEVLPLWILGLAAIWQRLERPRLSKAVTLSAIIWNILLWLQYIGQAIAPTSALVFPDWLAGQATALKYVKEAVGRSAVFSNLYFGLTEDPVYFIYSVSALLLFLLAFWLLIIALPGPIQDGTNSAK